MRRGIKQVENVCLNGSPLIISTIDEIVDTIDPCVNVVYKEEKYQPKYKKPAKIKIDPYQNPPILPCRSLSMNEIFKKVVGELNEEYQNKFVSFHNRAKGKMEKIWLCYKILPITTFSNRDMATLTSKYLSSPSRVKGLLLTSGLVVEHKPNELIKETLSDTEVLEIIIDSNEDLMSVDSKRHLNQNKIRQEKRIEKQKEEQPKEEEEIFTIDDAEVLGFVKSFDLFKKAFPKLGLIKFVELWYEGETGNKI